MFFSFPTTYILRAALLLALSLPMSARSVEWSGLLDARAQTSDGERSWTRAGMGKTRFDSAGFRAGQAILGAQMDISDAVRGFAVLNASDDRRGLVDLQEAWLGWNPVPTGPWKVRIKVGLFFPPVNQEIDYDRLTWTPTRTISASAINSWIGEELRTKGLELCLTHRGRASGSPHDFGATAAIFNGNDPAGTLLAWRGWAIGDRITGVSEAIRLADLPVYRSDGAITKQTRDINLLREIDGRAGYYAALNYAYSEVVEVAVMHYDNRGDPLIVKAGQYSWATKFNHLGLRIHPGGGWELMTQWLTGSTAMGARAVAIDYRAWYVLASHPLGPGTATLRYDQFRTREHDLLPSDPNSEDGRAVALAYVFQINPTVNLVTELLALHSVRQARVLLGDSPSQHERSLTTSLRWQF
ncbi:hypothetical protein IMCC9480_1008 [Oxalobacteraceae bacterium IMCC9480]|nr:hypothetical protein IMCC9480_1008 [Oxalobacteraceae bacterium IMCC9480]